MNDCSICTSLKDNIAKMQVKEMSIQTSLLTYTILRNALISQDNLGESLKAEALIILCDMAAFAYVYPFCDTSEKRMS